jgi:hypothetical protein
VLVAKAFAQVTEDNPELARQEAKYQPQAPSSSVPSASIEPPAAAPAASTDLVEQRLRVFALPRSPPVRYQQPSRIRSSWSN